MVRLASLYETGTGVERDLEESREWLSTAAKLGNLQAAFKLGELQVERKTSEEETIHSILLYIARSWFGNSRPNPKAGEASAGDVQLQISC